jgi:hypothetical protein
MGRTEADMDLFFAELQSFTKNVPKARVVYDKFPIVRPFTLPGYTVAVGRARARCGIRHALPDLGLRQPRANC